MINIDETYIDTLWLSRLKVLDTVAILFNDGSREIARITEIRNSLRVETSTGIYFVNKEGPNQGKQSEFRSAYCISPLTLEEEYLADQIGIINDQ